MAALKGAFLNFGAGLLGVLPNIVVFQFNPTQVTRTPSLSRPPQDPAANGPSNAAEQPSFPVESMSFTLRVDATEQLAQSNPLAAASGILPTLSALELLLVPQDSPSANLAALSQSSPAGGSSASSHQHPPTSLPTVLFFWGPLRILPITINSLSITETEYDTLLNPIRADVAVTLQVVLPEQLAPDRFGLGKAAYDYSLGVKKVMAALNLANAAQFGLSSVLSFSV